MFNTLKNLLFKQQEATVFAFNGGVHPAEHKLESTQHPIAKLMLPERLVLPLRQHVGNLPKLRVQVGDKVKKGQLLAIAEGAVSAAIHAPTSGEVSAIAESLIPHPSGLPDMCITLSADGLDTWGERVTVAWQNTDKEELIARLRNSGIVGLGGATFPTQIKLHTKKNVAIHTLIINAAECEPFISCDDMLMRERATEIMQGILITQYLLGAKRVLIGIEDNKCEAREAMSAVIPSADICLRTVPTLYPSGDARRLIFLLLNTEIPYNKRTTDMGIQVFNVATVLAIYRYFVHGEPSFSRIVTVSGNVQKPRNFEALFGTPLCALLQAAGGVKPNTTQYIMGGPMMGFVLPSQDVPVTKAMNCVIATHPSLFAPPPTALPCIRCARCADACPVNLQPQDLYWFAKAGQFEKAKNYKLFDCIECGCCSYVCPSHIPLVQYYRYAKSEIIATDKAREAADVARQRNELRLERIQREKEERAQKHAERAQGKRGPPDANQQAAISAAIARTSNSDAESIS